MVEDMSCQGFDECAGWLLLTLALFALFFFALVTVVATAAGLILSALSLASVGGKLSAIPKQVSIALLTMSVLCFLCMPGVVPRFVIVALAVVPAFWITAIIFVVAWVGAKRESPTMAALPPSRTPTAHARDTQSERPTQAHKSAPTPGPPPPPPPALPKTALHIRGVPVRRVLVYAALLAISLVGLVLISGWTLTVKLIASEGIVTGTAVATWWLIRSTAEPAEEAAPRTRSHEGRTPPPESPIRRTRRHRPSAVRPR
ncbi:MAG: hypothetical protein IT198_11505 [Acidimicrobiia bacterium]|nr:hypothetical protein [Acidimicrobiia bacterium]